jgi:hypothetical protein
VDMAAYEKGVDSFATLLTDAQDGGKKAVSAKDKQRIAVIKMCTLLGHYLEVACNDDPATFNIRGARRGWALRSGDSRALLERLLQSRYSRPSSSTNSDR